MRDRLKAVTPLVVSAIVVGIAAIAVVGAYANHASAEPTTSTEYAEYRNSRFGFSLPYPGDMTVGVYDQPDAGKRFNSATLPPTRFSRSRPPLSPCSTSPLARRVPPPPIPINRRSSASSASYVTTRSTCHSSKTVWRTPLRRWRNSKPGSPTSSRPGNSPTGHAGNATSTSVFATTVTSTDLHKTRRSHVTTPGIHRHRRTTISPTNAPSSNDEAQSHCGEEHMLEYVAYALLGVLTMVVYFTLRCPRGRRRSKAARPQAIASTPPSAPRERVTATTR